LLARIRGLLFGKPIPTSKQKHERLSKFFALPVFASDAISSNAYATEEILAAFAIAGAGAIAWSYGIWITGAIVALLAIVVVSYTLTIHAYPHGGGSYIVTRENLGTKWGLIAAAALLTDYVLTVAVSISAGVAAITSANANLAEYAVMMGVGFVALVAFMNLRGLRESGAVFAIPTYGFVLCVSITIIVGLYKVFSGQHIEPVNQTFPIEHQVTGMAMLFLCLRAFAGGCSAMTGTEAVADGIPAFRAPEAKNASETLWIMAAILAFLFLGISTLAMHYKAVPGIHGGHVETILSQIARGVFGKGWFYYLIQGATAAILVLAANTAYQDYPRLSSILARDRFAPRQFARVGDRLVFNNGILVLSLLAAGLIILFKCKPHAMIPLYAIGVFISFTLSQFSMGLRTLRAKKRHWKVLCGISFFGSFVTCVVSVVTAAMKFTEGPKIPIGDFSIPTGAYIVLIVILVMVYTLSKINHHYLELGRQLRIDDFETAVPEVRSTAIVLVGGIHKGVLGALEYAKTLSHDCRALYIEIDAAETALVTERWEKLGLDMPLVVLESKYRSMIDPVMKYLEEAKKEREHHVITVVLPEFVPRKWWHQILHGQSGLMLKVALMLRKDIILTNVRYYLEK
jgi:amino acid transporter